MIWIKGGKHTKMELRRLFSFLRRWSWLIVLAAIVSGSLAYINSRSQPLQYRASSIIQIEPYSSLVNPEFGIGFTNAQLIETCIALSKTWPLLDAVIRNKVLPFEADTLAGIFQVEQFDNTWLLTITVTFTNPILTADIANALAAQLIAISPTDLPQAQQKQLVLLQRGILKADAQLRAEREELKTIENSLGSVTPQEFAVLMESRHELVKNISVTKANLAQSYATILTLEQQRPICCHVRLWGIAEIPDHAITPLPFNSIFDPALVGAFLASVMVLVIEYLNTKLQLQPK